ncbi:MAG: translation elongation factor-like protein [Pseudomonadota bacterium]|jgi:translation elongation factor EF-1alpha|uniref:Elongation factor Tu domain 2 n=1 Tax=anaerobic digester metagenome TaxID=1263854 RepID=A0A485M285_9ZZZZ|nr:translation elongation factor-like protein [Pseudomonadota bacterium]HON38856.1 translation elongation factor-like protein [Deltaproteobacteria bacterium]
MIILKRGGTIVAEEKKLIGKVTHYFGKISVAGISLTDTLKVGDTISIEGATTSFEEKVISMQIDQKTVEQAGAGDLIGIKVKDKVRVGDNVYLVS